MKSFMAKPETIQKKWYLIDADGQVLGRLASQVAAILRGKNKPEFTPNVDTGDHVVIINTDKVVLTGKKLEQKLYRRHSGKPGNLKEIKYGKLMAERSDFAVMPGNQGYASQKQSRSGYAQKGARLQGRRARAAGTAAAAFDFGGLIEVNLWRQK